MSIIIRAAQRPDADAIAAAHTSGWRVGYRGLFPDEYLDSDQFANDHAAMWCQWTWNGANDDRGAHLFVAEQHGAVIGFGSVGPERDQPSCHIDADVVVATPPIPRGEVYAFYLHADAWGTGAAAPLLQTCQQALIESGFSSAVLWVLRDNPRARAFYEKMGWTPTGETEEWTDSRAPIHLQAPVTEFQYFIHLLEFERRTTDT